ncbi:BadF/BadG/BcrA/BcrD ATPase family protein [Saxibacter everestensis]|uniref:BadF/BadG/BcrA/BcrD ATPase family protein n=1 Tax=Saxibacter everestensis TaxID=2909229 RepID=A0ABY8QT96_9MICO|nr:BadF/BadG/BcrA/BcrD ATPase family protein [Brevibacteriaceae bacterium ZFBP1038]
MPTTPEAWPLSSSTSAQPAGRSNVVLGLDIGGSKTHAAIFVDGVISQEAFSGSANTQVVSREVAAVNLRSAYLDLGSPPVDRICAGAAGVDTDNDVRRLRLLLADVIADVPTRIAHDSRLILAAGGLSTGIAVIAGTGSAVWGTRDDGRQARAGGWGYLLGDEGGGYWTSIQAVRHTLGEYDAGRDVDQLSRDLLEACGLRTPDELIHHVHSHADRRYWARHAGVVFGNAVKGHPRAKQIVETGADALAEMIAQVADRLEIHGPVILGGGLSMHQPAVSERIRQQLSRRQISDIRVLRQDPIHGVPLLADQKIHG